MSQTDIHRKSTRRFPFRYFSIEKRLPLFICILLLTTVLVFGITSYLSVRTAATRMGKERLRNLADQLSGLFGQSAQNMTNTSHLAAEQPVFKSFLKNPQAVPDTAVQHALDKMRPDSASLRVELVDANFNPVAFSAWPGITVMPNRKEVIGTMPLTPNACIVGNFYVAHDSLFFPIVAAISSDQKTIGYLIKWRLQKTTAKAVAQFAQLLGENTSLMVGNADGSLWSNLDKTVTGPPVAAPVSGSFVQYNRPEAGKVIAASRPIANTNWVILLEVSREKILAGANSFLRWIILVGLVLVAIGMFVAWRMSRSITRPLKQLTAAAAAISSGNYSSSVAVDRKDELGKLARSFNAMAAQVGAAQQDLEDKVLERTSQLEKANHELEAFSYSVSHDLRAPLRAISGFATMLHEDYGPSMDEEGNRLTRKIISNANKMAQLIDDLIAFSQTGRRQTPPARIDMNKMVESCMTELKGMANSDNYSIRLNELPDCFGAESLVRQVWVNLLSNAIKYSSRSEKPMIEVGATEGTTHHTYYVKDNGVGFDMRHAGKLFGVFQRLHSQKDFEGTGVGLALAKRIINQQGGDIWAEAIPGNGATFYFTMPVEPFASSRQQSQASVHHA